MNKVQAYAEHYTEKIDAVVADAIDQMDYLKDHSVMYTPGGSTEKVELTDEEEQDIESLVDFLEGVRSGLQGDR